MNTMIWTLFLSWILSIASAKGPFVDQGFASSLPIKLSIMDQSVDDMYSGCTSVMATRVEREYFPREMKNLVFNRAWKGSETCLRNALKNRKPVDKPLTENHLRALCVYTNEKMSIYRKFNEKVQSDAQQYGTGSFKYHTLHFWLTYALRILATNNQTCHSTVRRSDMQFTGQINQVIRFGSFASSSYKRNLLIFGTKTCFFIRTCLGAFLKYFSVFESEEEVLIPPYEMFMITNISENPNKALNCEKIIELKSVGVYSRLNCKAAFEGGFD